MIYNVLMGFLILVLAGAICMVVDGIRGARQMNRFHKKFEGLQGLKILLIKLDIDDAIKLRVPPRRGPWP